MRWYYRWRQLKYGSRRNERITKTDDGTVNSISLNSLLKKQNYQCAICDGDISISYERNIDHKIPLIKGGKHTISNLQWTHRRCNDEKGAYAPWNIAWPYYQRELDRVQRNMERDAKRRQEYLAAFISLLYHNAMKRLDISMPNQLTYRRNERR